MIDYKSLCIELEHQLAYWYAVIASSGNTGTSLRHVHDLLERTRVALDQEESMKEI
jgi:hypothetical protein